MSHPPSQPRSCRLHQPPPPSSLSSILDSFRRSGEGDRELLLSILGAKKAEEEVGLGFPFLSPFPPSPASLLRFSPYHPLASSSQDIG
jgi:hypothetical protein